MNRRRILIALALTATALAGWSLLKPARDARLCATWQMAPSGDSITLNANGYGSVIAGGDAQPIAWWVKDDRLCVEILETQLLWRLRALWGHLTANPQETMSWRIVEVRTDMLLLSQRNGKDVQMLLREPVLLNYVEPDE